MQQEGTYNSHIKRGVLSKAKNGSPQFVLVFDVVGYYDGRTWSDITPMERTVYLSMSGGAKDYTKKKLAAIGYTEPKFEKDAETGEQVMVLPAGIADESIQLNCKHGTKQDGSPREEWDLPWGGSSTGEAASDEDVMKVAALW